MTKSKFGQIKLRIAVILTAFFMLFSGLFFLTACNDSNNESSTDTDYTYTEIDNGDIKNANFDFQALNYAITDYPIQTPTGWNKATADSSSPSSSTNSGVVDTSSKAWKELLSKLYDSSAFLSYAKENVAGGWTDDEVKTALKEGKDSDYTPTSKEIKEYVIENYLANSSNGFISPGVREGATDNNVLMINNYDSSKSSTTGGLGQKVTSTSAVTLEKGKIYKLSLYVKCYNVSGSSGTTSFGANIRLASTINSNTQQDFKISNIKNTDWKMYTIYIQADDTYDSTVTLSLGLGYGNNNSNNVSEFTRGTVYFDDITFEKVDAIPDTINSSLIKKLTYGAEEDKYSYDLSSTEIDYEDLADTDDQFVYDMTVTAPSNYQTQLNILSSNTYDFTKSNIDYKTSVDFGDATLSKIEPLQDADPNSFGLKLTKSSATISIKNSNFAISGGEYARVSFKVKTDNLYSALGSTDLTIDVRDIFNGNTEKRPAVATITPVDAEWTTVSLYIKNNFEDTSIRNFGIDVIVGPTKIAECKYLEEFVSGDVQIKDLAIAKGNIENDASKDDAQSLDVYNLNKLYVNTATATLELYAGYANAPELDSDNNTFSFSSAYGDKTTILSGASDVYGYSGVIANHTYITNNNDSETTINTRKGSGNTSGIAGLINTKYFDTQYEHSSDIKTALGYKAGDEDSQPLMIYNIDGTSYGFVGEKHTIQANENATISIKLKVVNKSATELAKAYIYLVDVSEYEKKVLTFENFTVNNDKCDIAQNTEIDGSTKPLVFEVGDTNGEFVTLTYYLANGDTEKNLRIELWNGARDNSEANSFGYVFVDSIDVKYNDAFTEAANWNSTWNSTENPLGALTKNAFRNQGDELITYKRELTDLEKQFNKEYPEQQVSYNTKYIWAKNATTIYAVFNSIDVVEVDPYLSIVPDEPTDNGCTAKSDPSTFWLSFSSLVLAVALVGAIVALLVKSIRRKLKYRKSDAKSHYNVKSRISAKKLIEKNKEVEVEESLEDKTTDVEEENNQVDETSNEDEQLEVQLEEDSYIYGDVQNFGETDELNQNDEENDSKNQTEN